MTIDSIDVRDTGMWRAIGGNRRKLSTLYFHGFGKAHQVPELQHYSEL